MFPCKYCKDKSFTSEKGLRMHRIRVHSKKGKGWKTRPKAVTNKVSIDEAIAVLKADIAALQYVVNRLENLR